MTAIRLGELAPKNNIASYENQRQKQVRSDTINNFDMYVSSKGVCTSHKEQSIAYADLSEVYKKRFSYSSANNVSKQTDEDITISESYEKTIDSLTEDSQGIPYLNSDVMESVNKQLAIARASKNQGQLDTIAGLYKKYVGNDTGAPNKYEDITETDFALYRLFEQSGINGGYQTLIGMYPNTMYT